MVSRFAAGFVVIAMLLVGATPCAGWQASAKARHDCCAEGACPNSLGEMAGHSDLSQEAADRCCAASEEKGQRDAAQSVAAFFAVPPPTALGVAPHTEAADLRRPHPDSGPIAPPGAPLYLLFSVFLV